MKRIIPILLILISVACSPRLYPPQVKTPENYLYAKGFSTDTIPADSCWWRLFGDRRLDSLIEQALKNNRNLEVAAIRVEEARDNLKSVKSAYLPQIGAGVSAKGNYADETGIVQSYAIAPTMSWEVSLFGALRNNRRAAKAALAAAVWEYKGMQLSVAAEVATTYFTMLEYQNDLEIARQTLLTRQESEALTDSLFRYGMSDGVSLNQARSLVYTAEADIPQYRRAIAQTWLSMGILLGETPAMPPSDGIGMELMNDAMPEEIPIGLPAALLTRRPDIQQSRYEMMQAASEAKVARSARFPSISLTAKGGVASTAIKDLTTGKPWMWQAVGSLTEPIFAFGKLRLAEREAIDNYNMAAKNYEQTVLTAFADTEQALVAITSYRRQTERTAALVIANSRIAKMTQALYRSGLADYLSVLDAERSLYTSQMQLIQLVAQQYINYVNLCKALGGGYKNGNTYK